MINDGKEELQEITKEEELVERSLFDQYELGDPQQSKTNTTSAFISTPEIPSNENDMGLDEIPVMEQQYEPLKYKSKRCIQRSDNYSRSTTLVGQSSKDNIGVTSGRKIDSKPLVEKHPRNQEKPSPHLGQLWGGSDALTKEENVETTSDELSKDSWLVENNLQIDQDTFFAELTEGNTTRIFVHTKIVTSKYRWYRKSRSFVC